MRKLRVQILIPAVALVVLLSYQACGIFKGFDANNNGSMGVGLASLGDGGYIFSKSPLSALGANRPLTFTSFPTSFTRSVNRIVGWDHQMADGNYCDQSSGNNPWEVTLTCESAGELTLYMIIEYIGGEEEVFTAQVTLLEDPDDIPTPVEPPPPPPPPTPLDGPALYQLHCAGCHGSLAQTAKPNRTASSITGSINLNVGGMGSLSSLSQAEIQAIAQALVR